MAVRAEYDGVVREINGKRVGIVVDLMSSVSVTNDIENVAQQLGVKRIIYKDSDGIWDYWNSKTGFRTLAVGRGQPTKTERDAIDIAEKRYITEEE